MLRDDEFDENRIYGEIERTATWSFLDRTGNEILETELFTKMNEYYKELAKRKNTGKLKRFIERLEFDEVGLKFKLIDDKKESVFVLTGKDENKIVFNWLEKINRMQDKMRRKNEYLKIKNDVQKYVVNIREDDMKKLTFAGEVSGFKVLSEGFYDKNMGVTTFFDNVI